MEIIIAFLLGIGAGFIIFGTGRNKPAGPRRPSAIFAAVLMSDNLISGDIKMLELKEGQKAALIVSLRTAHGHAGAIEPGSARFTSSDESVVSVEQNPENELEATIRGLDGSANESVVIEFHADGDRSEGVRSIVGVMSVTCTQGDAFIVELTAGPVEDDTAAGEPQPLPTEPDAEPAEPAAETPADSADSGVTTGGDVNGGAVTEDVPVDPAEDVPGDTASPSNEVTGPFSPGGSF